MHGQSSSGVLFFLLVGFLAWWWWPSIEPEVPSLADRARTILLTALGQAEEPVEVAGSIVAPAASPRPGPPSPTATPEPAVAEAPFCAPGQQPAFVLGFAALKQRLGAAMGEPLECEHANPENGDALQQTTTGLAVYDRSTNTPRFTDGWRSWALTGAGLVSWEGPNAPRELVGGRAAPGQ